MSALLLAATTNGWYSHWTWLIGKYFPEISIWSGGLLLGFDRPLAPWMSPVHSSLGGVEGLAYWFKSGHHNNGYAVSIPLWMIAIVLLGMYLFASPRARMFAATACLTCGYDHIGLPEPSPCPECGERKYAKAPRAKRAALLPCRRVRLFAGWTTLAFGMLTLATLTGLRGHSSLNLGPGTLGIETGYATLLASWSRHREADEWSVAGASYFPLGTPSELAAWPRTGAHYGSDASSLPLWLIVFALFLVYMGFALASTARRWRLRMSTR